MRSLADPDQADALRRTLPAWSVRPMVAADVGVVLAIEQSVYEFPWTRGNFEDSLRQGHDAWVLESGVQVVGHALLMWLPDEVHLLNLGIDRGWQGRGLGAAMLDWLMANVARRGALAMLLEVRPSNVAARALYARKGFVQIGVRKRYYPAAGQTREDALVLRRSVLDE